MNNRFRRRRLIIIIVTILAVTVTAWALSVQNSVKIPVSNQKSTTTNNEKAINSLAKLPIKGRAPKTGYTRAQFGDGWRVSNGCNTREAILNRDLENVTLDNFCQVLSGVLNDPYSGKVINFKRGSTTSAAVQIDHVVALSDAWQKGAQQLTQSERENLANDPLELLAVDGATNQKKSDGDAATWLPPNKAFRCQYVARQVAVKLKYRLWVTSAERDAISRVLESCPEQGLPAA